jgi:hypothetical protein
MDRFAEIIKSINNMTPEETAKLLKEHKNDMDTVSIIKSEFETFTKEKIDIYNPKIQAVAHGWLASKNLYILMAMISIAYEGDENELDAIIKTTISECLNEARRQYEDYNKNIKNKD